MPGTWLGKCDTDQIRIQQQRQPGEQNSRPCICLRGRHPPFKTAPVADSQRSLTRYSKLALARIAKGGGLIALHALRMAGRRTRAVASRVTIDHRNTPTRHGSTRHRHHNQYVAHEANHAGCWTRKIAFVQNSFGPRRSSLPSQVIRVATTLMSTIPATLTATCMAMVPENSSRTTWPMNDSKTPRQYIASEFSPQRIIAVIRGFSGPRQWRAVSRTPTTASARKCNRRSGDRLLLSIG